MHYVSVLFNEPKLLKMLGTKERIAYRYSFSALQRAEIAENSMTVINLHSSESFSALQRAEIAEKPLCVERNQRPASFQCSSTSRNC